MSIKFAQPTTREGWSNTLEDIIAAGRASVQQKNRSDLSDANTALNEYITALNNSDFWTHDLDHAAREALGYLTVDIATATVDDLASRTNELVQIANTVNATANANEQAAGSIRHDKLVQAMTSAMDAAKAAKDLQVAVRNNAGDTNIATAAESLLQAISNFKDVVAKADP